MYHWPRCYTCQVLVNGKGTENMDKDKVQALSIAMQAYEMKLELLSSATVVERAVNFVDKHKGLTTQIKEVVIDGPIKPITNSG